jgi:putative acetyltransferase
MSASAHPTIALRPVLPQDAPFLAEILRASVEELTSEDYTPAQQDAWASAADDVESFGARLGKHLALVATVEGSPVGFVSLDAPTEIALLYVHPLMARQGVGKLLYDAVERLSVARGVLHLIVEASDTAREFFEHLGFVAERRNTLSVGDEWLANTTMKKKLPGSGHAAPEMKQ